MRISTLAQVRRWLAAGLGLGLVSVAQAQADGARRWAFTTLSTATAGTILSSPAVGPDGTVYVGVEVGAASSAAPSGRLFALTPAGAQKWVFNAPDWIDSTPAIAADGTVYFGCWNGVLYSLRPDGTKRWEIKAGTFIASSPALGADGTIYVGAGSSLVAVNPDGSLKWSFPVGDWVDSSPAIAPDGSIVVGSWDNSIYALRPDGTEKWRYATGGNVTGSPAVAADGTVYVGSRDANVYALNADGTLRWRIDTTDTVEASPVLGPDGTVYVATTGGRMLALDRDGAERWRYPAAGQPALNAIYSSAAVRSDGTIVFGSSNNALYALRPDGTLLWRSAMDDWSDASPLVTGDTIYLGAADKKLYAFASSAGLAASDWPQHRRDPARNARAPAATVVGGGTGRLINLSVRTTAGSGDDALIVGFVVAGAGGRSLLVRGIGPTLGRFNVNGVLADPRIALYAGSAQIGSNDDWGLAANAAAIASTASAVGAFPLVAGSLDAAALNSFAAGGYTVQVAGANGASGVALMEAYDAGGGATARLANVSARSVVGAGADILIAGFVVQGGACTILVRAVGPGLVPFGVGGTLVDPELGVFREAQAVAANNDWSASGNATLLAATARAVGAFDLPGASRDAVVLVTLQPGAYTAQMSGVGGTTGVGLLEVYQVP
jgi:outer membrane protein assembly factor BamB